tara:strand:+ start:6444 stop:6704 length:261 start_codon:yes stop_codon:yes gene_type:complete
MSRSDKTISVYDTEGVFVLMAEGKNQGPIIMETEGTNSSRSDAETRMNAAGWAHRMCICRVIPVSGNELLALDMVRMQPKKEENSF